MLTAQIGKLFIWQDFCLKRDPIDALFIVGFLGLIIYIYLDLTPPSTYLVDFACFRAPDELKITEDELIELANKNQANLMMPQSNFSTELSRILALEMRPICPE